MNQIDIEGDIVARIFMENLRRLMLGFVVLKFLIRFSLFKLLPQSEHIRTIIKARGISYPNVTGKTFAVFRVDSKHHLVSLVSMIYPSPDWFVGVSGLELCLGNGSWVEQKILNLYPYDAGTDSGPTYISPDQPTIPKEAIRRIKPNQPNDPRSPFHDADNKEMKPLARLYLSRQRLYEKNCDALHLQDTQNDCAVGKWTDWSKVRTKFNSKSALFDFSLLLFKSATIHVEKGDALVRDIISIHNLLIRRDVKRS